MHQTLWTFPDDISLFASRKSLFYFLRELSKGVVTSLDGINGWATLFFFNKNIVFPAQDEYSYFSADFRLTIYTLYSCIILKLWHMTFPFCNVLAVSIISSVQFLELYPITFCTCSIAQRGQDVMSDITWSFWLEKSTSHRKNI